jgi:hypothetical protein
MKGNRIDKAHRIAELGLIGVLTRDNENRITSASVPGSNGKKYEVIVRRNGGITTECRLDIGIGHEQCKGNRMTVCYHSLAVLILCAMEADRGISFCKKEVDAERLSRIEGTVVKIAPFRTPERPMYMVVTGGKPICAECLDEVDEVDDLGHCFPCGEKLDDGDHHEFLTSMRATLYS